jgi:hypothetical protein
MVNQSDSIGCHCGSLPYASSRPIATMVCKLSRDSSNNPDTDMTSAHRHERKCPSVTRQDSQFCTRLPAFAGEDALLQGGALRAARGQMSAPAIQPCTSQVADQIANTPRNTRLHPRRLCYFYCMISPIRGDLTGFRVQVPPRTLFRKLLSTDTYRCDPASTPNWVW